MSVELQNEPWIPGGVSQPMSWDPVGKLWMPAPPAPNSITTAMLVPNAATAAHYANAVTSNPTTTSTTPVDLPDMTLTFTLPVTCDLLVSLHCTIASTLAGANQQLLLNADGVDAGNAGGSGPAQNNGSFAFGTVASANGAVMLSLTTVLQGVPAGAHTLKGRWLSGAGTATAVSLVRALSVLELRR